MVKYSEAWYAVNALYALVGVFVIVARVLVILACCRYLSGK